MKPFEVFKVGTHKAANGEKITFNQQDLDDIVAGFDENVRGAPLVVGHPATDDPAYGWAEKFTVVDGVLMVHPKQVNPEFSEAVKSGRFKTRSIAFIGKDDPYNPTPGRYYPRHIGFLGAKAPAISGLKTVSFAANETDITFETAGPAFESAGSIPEGPAWVSSLLNGFRQILGGGSPEFSVPADASYSANIHPKKEHIMSHNKTGSDIDFAAQQAKVEAQQAQLEKDKLEFAAKTAAARLIDDQDFVKSLSAAGKVAPGAVAGLIEFMGSLGGDSESVIEFAAGDDGAVVKKTPRDYFKDMLTAAKPLVEFSSEATGDTPNAQPGATSDPNVLARKAVEFQSAQAAAGVTISVTDAIKHVQSLTT